VGADAESMLWIGGEGGMEADLVAREAIPFEAIPAAGVHGVGLRALPGNLWRLVRGTLAARRLVRQFQPDVMLFTGGYVAAPVAVASPGIPKLLYVPDIEPGMALRFMARFARCIAVTAESSRAFLPRSARVVVTGYPTRSDLAQWQPAAAREALGLNAELPVVLIFGGSKGARSINRAVLANLPQLLAMTQVIHISGKLDWAEVEATQQTLTPELASRYQAYPYLYKEMGAALAAADLAVSRAGASTLGEYPLFGLPAILVPYPYAWRYQKVNADELVQAGAAELLPDEDLTTQLIPMIEALLNDHTQLSAMQQAMRALARPDAAEAIARLVRDLAGLRGRKATS